MSVTESVCVRVCVCSHVCVCVCVCVWMCARESERVCVRERGKKRGEYLLCRGIICTGGADLCCDG